MHTDADHQLDRLLPRQHGTFNLDQARQLGFTPTMVKRRLQNGQWRRMDPAVYAHTAYRPTWEQRCTAAVLAEPTAVLGGKTSAAIDALVGFHRGPVELTVPPAAAHPTRLARVRRSTLIEPRMVDGFRVQSVVYTFVELAAHVSFDRLDRAFEDAVLRQLTTLDAMAQCYVELAHSRRPGLRSLRGLLESRGGGWVPSESELELMLFRALDDPQIPPVTRQAPFPWAPTAPHRVDGLIEEWGIVVEADGRRWHARLETMDEDRRRDQELIRHGLLPIRFGWFDLRDDADRVRQVVIDAGRRRHPNGWSAAATRSAVA